jgi:hypothetical protein
LDKNTGNQLNLKRQSNTSTSFLIKRERWKVMARRRRKFVRLSSYWPENVRGTSFLGKKESNGPPQAKIWWVKYVAAGGKM